MSSVPQSICSGVLSPQRPNHSQPTPKNLEFPEINLTPAPLNLRSGELSPRGPVWDPKSQRRVEPSASGPPIPSSGLRSGELNPRGPVWDPMSQRRVEPSASCIPTPVPDPRSGELSPRESLRVQASQRRGEPSVSTSLPPPQWQATSSVPPARPLYPGYQANQGDPPHSVPLQSPPRQDALPVSRQSPLVFDFHSGELSPRRSVSLSPSLPEPADFLPPYPYHPRGNSFLNQPHRVRLSRSPPVNHRTDPGQYPYNCHSGALSPWHSPFNPAAPGCYTANPTCCCGHPLPPAVPLIFYCFYPHPAVHGFNSGYCCSSRHSRPASEPGRFSPIPVLVPASHSVGSRRSTRPSSPGFHFEPRRRPRSTPRHLPDPEFRSGPGHRRPTSTRD